jgi:hypothetical protein
MAPAAPGRSGHGSASGPASGGGCHDRIVSKGELSSLTATMEEVGRRVVALAAENEAAGREDTAIDLYEVERSIRSAVRRLAKLSDAGRKR